ncbi:hypothetical protein ABIE44_001636 [Marmoricola sp. OAE513]|uniref:hypothetical protein n=1 Tax=Marmoricola sp. OAE513 TaxID=2817894 RepID=UPI001AE94BCF
MKSSRAVVLLALVAALALTGGTAGAATSTKKPSGATTYDKAGDVYFTTTVAGSLQVPGGKATKQRNGDIRTVRVKHTATQVRVRLRYVELARSGTQHLHVVQLTTSKKKAYEVDLYAGPGAWRGVGELVDARGASKRCALKWDLDYRANTALIVVPRSCIGRPGWIRAGAGTTSMSGDTRYADDGLSARKPGSVLALGPKLYR